MTTDERRRGPKRAAVNKPFAYAVQDSDVGMHGASLFLASLDIAPVAPSHCQKLAKLADTEMSTVNQKDMDCIRTQTTLNNALLGLSGGGREKLRFLLILDIILYVIAMVKNLV